MSDRRLKSDAGRLERHHKQSCEGMRRYRDLRKRGLRRIVAIVPNRWLERMLESGRLKDHELSDPEALGRALAAPSDD